MRGFGGWIPSACVRFPDWAGRAPSRAAVRAFRAAAVAAGGFHDGAPGLRPQYGEHYYAAFVRDAAGNRIEAVCRVPPH